MAAEALVQVVDANDVPLRSATKDEIHQKGLWYRAARVMVEDGQGNLLIQKRVVKKLFPHRWDNSAAGHVDEGESYEATATRELEEEIGISGAGLEEIGYYSSMHRDGEQLLNEWQKVFRVTVPQSTPLLLQKDEVAATRWLSIQEVKVLVAQSPETVTPGLKDVIEKYY